MIGTTLGQFRVVERIGAGGMGVVYKAHDETLDRHVVLKVLPPGALGDETARKRFRAEALALSRLNHPNICTIHQVGDADGQTYIAMEHVEGRPLDQLIRAGPMPPDVAARYGAQIAAGLAHAHARDLMHRDVKSANVIITSDGRAKMLDFGLAVPSSASDTDATRTRLTQSGAVVGTPQYMPPEAIRGEQSDARSDIWALGVVLFEMVTGTRPFSDSGHALTYAILERSPEIPDSVPPALQSIIRRCLAKQPGERYQTADAVQAALETIGERSRTSTVSPAESPARRSWTTPIVGAVAVVFVAWLAFVFGDLSQRFGGAPAPVPVASLAVLPFTNLSPDAGQEYFVDGMTDALINELAKLDAVRVIARTTVMGYKGSNKSAEEIAAELGVDGIVEGSATSLGGQVQLRARLIHVASSDSLWSGDFTRDLSDILSLQSEMARTIGARIEQALTPEAEARLGDATEVDPDAYDLTLQGRFHANRLSQEELETAIDYFDQAIATDPRHAPAFAGKAFAYTHLSSVYVAPLVAMPEAKAAANRAIELDDGLAEAHTWLGYVRAFFDWDWEGAERELLRALELNPNSVEALLAYSGYLVTQSRLDDAIQYGRRAKALDPKSIAAYSSPNGSQWTLFMARRFDDAIADGRNALTVDPANAWAHAYLGLALVANGEFENGIAALDDAARLEPGPYLDALRSWSYAEAGREQDARALISQVEEISKEIYTCAYEVALTHVALGDHDVAFTWLDKAFEDRADCIPYLNVDPRLDPIRGDSRFGELLDRAGFDRSRAPARRP